MGNRTPANSQSYISILLVYGLRNTGLQNMHDQFGSKAGIYCKNKGSMGNRTPANSQSYISILLVYGLRNTGLQNMHDQFGSIVSY